MRLETDPDVFTAIATPLRREIIRRLALENGQSLSILATSYPMSRQAVTRHIKVLQKTGIISIRKSGREQLCYLNVQALKEVYQWISFYEQFWSDKMDKLGEFLAPEDNDET